MDKGKLIVLEGIDGSGKSSQYRQLCRRLQQDGVNFHPIVFPRYDRESSALIRLYLGGSFGQHPSDVNAFAASTFYAVDRYASYREDWGRVYESGGLILSDRYTGSNAVHQGSKLEGSQRQEYFRWLRDFEYTRLGLPEPDLVLYLDVSLELSLARVQRRSEKTGVARDIHETDTDYLARCLQTAGDAADFYGWHRIDYEKNGEERSLQEKAEEIYAIVSAHLH